MMQNLRKHHSLTLVATQPRACRIGLALVSGSGQGRVHPCPMPPDRKPRVLVVVIACDAESTIIQVLRRIPSLPGFDVEVLLIDDCSGDSTYARSEDLRRLNTYPHPLVV